MARWRGRSRPQTGRKLHKNPHRPKHKARAIGPRSWFIFSTQANECTYNQALSHNFDPSLVGALGAGKVGKLDLGQIVIHPIRGFT